MYSKTAKEQRKLVCRECELLEFGNFDGKILPAKCGRSGEIIREIGRSCTAEVVVGDSFGKVRFDDGHEIIESAV